MASTVFLETNIKMIIKYNVFSYFIKKMSR